MKIAKKPMYVSLHKHSLSVFLLSAKPWLLCPTVRMKPFVDWVVVCHLSVVQNCFHEKTLTLLNWKLSEA